MEMKGGISKDILAAHQAHEAGIGKPCGSEAVAQRFGVGMVRERLRQIGVCGARAAHMSSGSGVTITNLNFSTATPCFAAGSTATGGFTLSGNQNGVTSGGFQMNIQSTGSSTNLLTLQGTVSNNTISGTWALSGTTSGCSGSGAFTMNKS